MKLSLDKQERYTVLRLEEENVNSLLAPKLKSEFIILSNEGVRNLILDVSPVQYIDSSGLSAILTANRLFMAGEGTFILTGIEHPPVKRLIEISKLDSVLTILPTVSESVDYVFMEDLQRDIAAGSDEEEETEAAND
ncbi:MAG: STAS domain-containing protein [Saprospiraceae bacterium]